MAINHNISELFIPKTIEKTKEITFSIKDFLTQKNFGLTNLEIIIFWILPFLLVLIFFLYSKYKQKKFEKEKLKNDSGPSEEKDDLRNNLHKKYLDLNRKNNYVKVKMLHHNQKILTKYVLLDQYNIFTFKDKKYSMDDMHLFIFGYENNIPVLFYDSNFILPLKLTQKEVNKEIEKALGLDITDEDYSDKITAVSLKLNPQNLSMIYDKKLISDLYLLSEDSIFSNPMMKWILIGIAIFIAYQTGLFEEVKKLIGI